MYANALVNGILIGGFYSVLALGLSLVFGVLKLINLAHGAIIVAGSYLAYVCFDQWGLGPFAALPLVVVAAAAIAYLLQRYLLTGLLLRGADTALVATFGIALLLEALYTEAFGSDPRSLNSSLSTAGFALGPVQVRSANVVAFAIAVVLCLATHLLLTRTRAGALVRAAAADPRTAGLMGINIRTTYAVIFAIGAGIAAMGGVLTGITFSFAPTTGTQYLLTGIAVVVLGGVGNVLGTLAGGIVLGLLQSLAAAQFGGGYRDLAVYCVFFVVLVFRPQGLFARRAAA
ncbi:branched-chain amino acid ABC transporter permease [Streptomyces sp. So13.3]|uniref:branched-chain amino acid ABC transporter permease n=1 Tax=Streptomyces TaxID=1883 RepID=UPI001105A750|nr:branched-chain amino acid ABC transporter permease [Streptomyces sp. So13.3]QNA76303.1 branched-chain amino acid ABC transporter permease [Streptomyces sp. So13.3]